MKAIIAGFLTGFLILQAKSMPSYARASDNQPKPQFELQTGHTELVNAIAMTSDGKHLITGSMDRTAKLWDVSTGMLIRTFSGHDSPIDSVAVSPHGKLLATGHWDGTVVLWNMSTGSQVRTLKSFYGSAAFVAFCAEGNYLVAGGNDPGAKLWDLSSGREVRTFAGFHWQPGPPRPLPPFYVNDKYLIGATDHNKALVWSLPAGEQVATFQASTQAVSFSMTADGKYIVAGCVDGTTELWDFRTRKAIRTFRRHLALVSTVGTTSDGEHMVTGSYDETIGIWGLSTGKEIGKLDSLRAQVLAIAIAPDGDSLVVCLGHRVELWSLSKRTKIRSFEPHSYRVSSTALTPDGKYLVTGGSYTPAKLWDLSTGQQIRTYAARQAAQQLVTSVAISPDGEFLVTGGWDGIARLWNLANGQAVRTFQGHRSSVESVAISPDGKYLATGSRDHTAKLWVLATGEDLRTFQVGPVDSMAVAFMHDSKHLVTGDDSAKLWDLSTGEEIRHLTNPGGFPGDFVKSIAVIPGGKYLATAGGHASDVGQLWDIATGKPVRIIRGYHVASTPDGAHLVTAGNDATATLWDLQTGAAIRTFRGHSDRILSITVSSDGKYLVTGSLDGSTKLWNMATGGNISLVSSGSSDDWIMFNPDGYFDASPNGGDLVRMVTGMTPYGVDQFAVRSNRPDIILESLGLGNPETIANYAEQYQKRLRKIGIAPGQLEGDSQVPGMTLQGVKQDGKHLSVSFSLSEAKHRIKSYNVFANDVPLFGAYGKAVVGNELRLTEKIELASGRNKIELSCMDTAGNESLRALTFADYGEKVLGDLYFIGFGASSFKNKELNLKYADKDVKDLAELFSKMRGKQFRNVITRTYLNEDVTVQNIRSAKKLLDSAQVDDTFVLFIAGHGVHDKDAAATYYFATHDTDIKALSKTAADFDLLEDLLQEIAPRKKLFLMDTCESGEAEQGAEAQWFSKAKSRGLHVRTSDRMRAMRGGGPARPFLLRQGRYIYNDLLRRSGAIVFSSSQGGEYSLENDGLGNGLFTEGIIAALSTGKGDKDGDGIVQTDELRSFVTSAVSEMSGDMQHPTVDRDNIYQKFGFPLVR